MKQDKMTIFQIGVLVGIFLICLFLAIPAYIKYQDNLKKEEIEKEKQREIERYTKDLEIQKKINHGLEFSVPVLVAVTKFFNSTKELPNSSNLYLDSPDLTSYYYRLGPKPSYVTVKVGEKGVITVLFNLHEENGSIILTPFLNSNGDGLDWDCKKGTLKTKYRPEKCRE